MTLPIVETDGVFYADDFGGVVDGTTRIAGNVSFHDTAWAIGNADLDSGPFGHIELSGGASVRDETVLRGNVAVYGSAVLTGRTIIIGSDRNRVDITGDAHIVDGRIYRSWEYACFSHRGTWGGVWEAPLTVHRAKGGWNLVRRNQVVEFAERLEDLHETWLIYDQVVKPWEPAVVAGLIAYIQHHKERAHG